MDQAARAPFRSRLASRDRHEPAERRGLSRAGQGNRDRSGRSLPRQSEKHRRAVRAEADGGQGREARAAEGGGGAGGITTVRGSELVGGAASASASVSA